jgi:hypothetical protein
MVKNRARVHLQVGKNSEVMSLEDFFLTLKAVDYNFSLEFFAAS